MKLCFITTGNVKYIATMKRAIGMSTPLINYGWDVSIIALSCEENKYRFSLECPNVKVYFFNKSNPIKEVIFKHRTVNKINPDVIWICSLGVRNFLFRRNKYKILIEHSELGSSIPDNRGLKLKLIKFFESYSTKYSGLVCASKYLVNHFSKNDDLKIHYSPYAYSLNVMPSNRTKLNALSKKFKGKKVFLYLGTMTKNYGLFSMLNAFRNLNENHKNIALVLIGRGRHLLEARDFVDKHNLHNLIFFPGYIKEEELNCYFEISYAFLCPLNDTIQDWARCPSKIYMYLPYNKPIITSNIGEPREVFGSDGLYFDSSNPDSLSKVVNELLFKNETNIDYDINSHSWESRAKSFNEWFFNEFK